MGMDRCTCTDFLAYTFSVLQQFGLKENKGELSCSFYFMVASSSTLPVLVAVSTAVWNAAQFWVGPEPQCPLQRAPAHCEQPEVICTSEVHCGAQSPLASVAFVATCGSLGFSAGLLLGVCLCCRRADTAAPVGGQDLRRIVIAPPAQALENGVGARRPTLASVPY